MQQRNRQTRHHRHNAVLVAAFAAVALGAAGCSAPKFPAGSDKDGNISHRSVEKPTAMVTSDEMFNSTPNGKLAPAGRSGTSAPPAAVLESGQPVASYPVTSYPLAGSSQVAVSRAVPADADFARTAMSISATEIALARIAMVRAQDPEVRDFAARMLADHRAVAAQIDDYALRQGAAVDWSVGVEDQAAVSRLRGAPDAGFDRAYLDETIRAHERAAALLRTASGGSGEAALVARNTLPAVQQHLAEAQALETRL